MRTTVTVLRWRDDAIATVKVECSGDVADDDLDLRTNVEDSEISQAAWEASSLAHAWLRHGRLGVLSLGPLYFEWTAYGSTQLWFEPSISSGST